MIEDHQRFKIFFQKPLQFSFIIPKPQSALFLYASSCKASYKTLKELQSDLYLVATHGTLKSGRLKVGPLTEVQK